MEKMWMGPMSFRLASKFKRSLRLSATTLTYIKNLLLFFRKQDMDVFFGLHALLDVLPKTGIKKLELKRP